MSRRRQELGVGCLFIGAIALLAWMSLQVGALSGFADTIAVTVLLDDAAGLQEGAAIKVAGVEVGTVSSLEAAHDQARVRLELRADAALRTDAVVQVRARSLLGEKYMAITPQSTDAPLLADGDVLADARSQTEIDELINALGPLVQGVDSDALNRAIASLEQALADDPDKLRRMLDDLETILHNTAVATEYGPELVSETRETLGSIRQVSREARPAVHRAEVVLTRIDDATTGLPATVDKVSSLVDETRGAVSEGRAVLGKVDAGTEDMAIILDNMSEIDRWELRRLLREEGILVRMRRHEVEPTPAP